MARLEAGEGDQIADDGPAVAPDPLLQLGLMHCSGHAGAVDLVEAHKWFNLAALHGNADARRYRAEISAEMSRAEIGDAQRRAREWLRRH